MRMFQKPSPETLSEWLDVATKKLSVPAQARIRSEIGAHFAEAVDEQIQNGSSKPVAQMLALEQLGDPKAAAKRFRKHLFSDRQARLLAASIRESKNGIALLTDYVYFIAFAILALAFSHSKHRPLYTVMAFLVMVVLPTVRFVLLKTHETRGNVRWIVLIRSLTGFLPDAVLLCTLFLPLGDLAVVLSIVWCRSIVATSMPCVTIWIKLGRGSRDWISAPHLNTYRS
jgi:hypothetical protein